ncbi:hypothetical protein E4U56_004767 [Claviceps arundinis]|uniref:Uncharacterized protein n=1 Tax=Claviceps arundinis TaxID=1623583 RepID=A0A9P7MNK4_9HYPO|nr:hypothetical protein E4U56_004767 [Claviceps arundinis]
MEEGGDEEEEHHSEEEHSTSSDAQEGRADAVNPQTPPFTPQSARNDWRNASMPPFNFRIIQDYNDYVETRIEISVLSRVPLTPSVIRTFSKARKAGHSLALHGITATREMRLIKENALARTKSPRAERSHWQFRSTLCGRC